jgi:hypothetical protein
MGRLTGLARAASLLILIVLPAGGCGGGPTTPDGPAPVTLTLLPTPTFVGGPDRASFSTRVDNISGAVVNLTFPSSCQVLPHFVDRATGREVTPVGGGFACATVITRRTLGPGEWFVEQVHVKLGDAPQADSVVLPPGDYAIYARLEDQTYRTQSDRFSFTLR